MPRQKILFEAGPMLDSKKTGVGYYISHLFSSLQKTQAKNVELTGFYFNFLNRHSDVTDRFAPIKFHKSWLMPGKILSVCRRLGFQPFLELFVRSKAEVVVFTNYVSLPQIKKRKTALVVYDLSFLDVPEFTQAKNLRYLERFCAPSIQKADIIITISEFTKQRLHHYFPDLKANVVVTHIPPAQENASHASVGKRLADLGIKSNSYILYIGTIEPRKNLQNLVLAYLELSPEIRQGHALVIAGGKGWKDEAILDEVADAKAKGANIILTGYVSEDEKNTLYSNASCFVLPSHYEGFGMPLLEAMQYGTPTAASDIPVFHEVAGKATQYFDKDDPQDIAQKITSLLLSDSLRLSLSTEADKLLKGFGWEDNAKRVYEALQ